MKSWNTKPNLKKNFFFFQKKFLDSCSAALMMLEIISVHATRNNLTRFAQNNLQGWNPYISKKDYCVLESWNPYVLQRCFSPRGHGKGPHEALAAMKRGPHELFPGKQLSELRSIYFEKRIVLRFRGWEIVLRFFGVDQFLVRFLELENCLVPRIWFRNTLYISWIRESCNFS